ncbi:MAG: hypothetical protein WDZ63_13945 [Burkholderiales bacterium]
MNRLTWGSLFVVLIFLAGCAADGTGRGRIWLPGADSEQADVERMLEYYDRIARLKGSELAKEYESARNEFEKQQTESNRMQLAMLLSLPQAGFRDDTSALGLVQAWTRDRSLAESHLRPLALLLQNHLTESLRVTEALQMQSVRLRDEQRKAEAFQQKLEALLEMEMKMIEREQAAQPKRR